MKKKKKKKKKNKRKNQQISFTNTNFSITEVVIFIFTSTIFGMISGFILSYTSSSLSSIRKDPSLNEIISTYSSIKDNYYTDVDDKKLVDSAIDGMVQSLEDPYSSFMNHQSTDSFLESIDGKYVGIGISVVLENEYFVVEDVIQDGPADKAGIQVGDIILEIDGVDCRNISSLDLKNKIHGDIYTMVSLKILREDHIHNFSVKRKYIDVINVSDRIIEESSSKIGYIKIDVFSSNSYDQFENSLHRLEQESIQSLIIDVRDNPGGHLAQSKKILDLFFPKKVILYQLDHNKSRTKIYSTTKESREYPVVILMNHRTASASEVLVSCFQENYPSITTIGSTTYGKGSVQKSVTLSTGSSIKYTVQKWLTSKGKGVDGVGLVPDIIIESDNSFDDVVLQKAIDVLK